MYTQWIIDESIDVEIRNIPDSPFFIFQETIKFDKINTKLNNIYPKWIYFLIKKQEYHEKPSHFFPNCMYKVHLSKEFHLKMHFDFFRCVKHENILEEKNSKMCKSSFNENRSCRS